MRKHKAYFLVDRDPQGILRRVELLDRKQIEDFTLLWEQGVKVQGFPWRLEIPVAEAVWKVGVK